MRNFTRRILLESPNVRGILLAVANGFLLAVASAIGKQVTQELSPFEVAFIRSTFMLMAMLPWLFRVGLRHLKTRYPGLQIIRSGVSAVAILLWFWALQTVPLADIAALEFLSPLWVLAGAILFLGEKSRLWRWAALGVGFAGTMVILRPGFAEVSIGALAVVASTFCFAANRLISKFLVHTESPTTVIAWRTALLIVFMIGPALWVWEWPSLAAWGWLVLLGVLGAVSQFTTIWAIKLADFGAIEPVSFLRLVWAALLGLAIFSEIPSVFTLLGGAIVIGSVIYVARRERLEAGPEQVPSGG